MVINYHNCTYLTFIVYYNKAIFTFITNIYVL